MVVRARCVVIRTFDTDGCIPRNVAGKFVRWFTVVVDPAHCLVSCPTIGGRTTEGGGA